MLKHEAMARITHGLRQFQSDVYPAQRDRFERLQRGQKPLALFIACPDSRLVPNLITQTEPGEIFTDRNPGNMVPLYEPFVGGVTASVEFAMLVLKVPLVVICGHTDCGVMKAVLNPDTAKDLPAVTNWMRHAVAARERMLRECPNETDAVKLKYLTQFNVLAQVEHLRSHPSVKQRLAAGDLDIIGWVYDIGSGSIWQADAKTGEFVDTREMQISTAP